MKPCPFCGSKSLHLLSHTGLPQRVQCASCGAVGPGGPRPVQSWEERKCESKELRP
jgi:uncharacterized Zn finger protein